MPAYLTLRVQYLLEQKITVGTNDSYKSAFRQYLRFCAQFGLKPLPLNEMTTLYWLAFRTTEVKASSAISGYYGVKKMALYHGHPVDDSKWKYLKEARATIDKVFGARTPDRRMPITFELLGKMYPYFNMGNYDDLVIYTMMVAATAGLLRTGEIFAKNKSVSPHKKDKPSVRALWNRNLKVTTDSKTNEIEFYECTIRATKTEKGHCDVQTVWAKGKWPVSPAELMTQYLHARIRLSATNPKLSLAPTAPLFQLLDGTIVTKADMLNRFNKLKQDMNLDMHTYTIYSFRIGGATSLARRGIDHRIIQIAGRWRSDAYALYIRMTPKMLATNQAEFLQRDVTHREMVFLHQNVPQNLLVRAH